MVLGCVTGGDVRFPSGSVVCMGPDTGLEVDVGKNTGDPSDGATGATVGTITGGLVGGRTVGSGVVTGGTTGDSVGAWGATVTSETARTCCRVSSLDD